MNSHWSYGGVVAAAIGLALLALPTPVAAEECRQACGAVAATAASEGRAAVKSCRLECRASADPGTCRASCRAAGKQTRAAIKASLKACSLTCRPANSCEEQCLAPARQCLAPIVEQAKSCTRDCTIVAEDAATACLVAADPLACLEDAARELHTCVQSCATTTRESADACKSALEDCKEGCAPENPCEGQCVPALHECLEPVVDHARQCGVQCADSAREEGAACLSQPDPAACLAQVAQHLAQCAIGCKNAAQQDARQCRTAFEGCVHDCLPANPCRDACYGELRECAAPIAEDLQTCGTQCASDALAAATACSNAQDKMACLIEVERVLSACASGCAQTARERAGACRDDFRQCTGTCEPPGDGTCRGACLLTTGQCLVEVAEGGKDCVRACASQAAPQVLPCLQQSDPRACLHETVQQLLQCARDCKPDVVEGASDCRLGLDACVGQCPADPCQDACIGTLEGCARSVALQTEACATACVASTLDAGEACLGQAYPLLCLGQVARDGLQCGAECRTAARADAGACWHDYRGCAQVCAQ